MQTQEIQLIFWTGTLKSTMMDLIWETESVTLV
ncbi:hypothetical protein Enr10x_33830 [Gimesia panareensis]|uniref:Uncharacterized protein n=1 Tax=Gimesia panareensis TaxID=2527978 RepID=A0A517Q8U0_9PLAN|nr:hypothetical protein Enr10x_33830 [Gimesia panareensis]